MEPTAGRAPGLAGFETALNVVFAPKEAFLSIERAPRWLAAFVIASLLGIAGQLLIRPAIQHMIGVTTPAQLEHNPRIASLPEGKREQFIARQVGIAKMIAGLGWVLTPIIVLIVALVQTVVALLFAVATRAEGGFARLFATAMHVQIVAYGLAALILGAIIALHGASSISSQADIYGVIPSLGWVVPGASKTLGAFLGSINVFSLWATVLFALGLHVAARFARGAAVMAAVLVLLLSAGIAAGGAQFSGA